MANKRAWKKRRNKEMAATMNQVQTVMTNVEGVMKNVYLEQLEAKKNKEKKYIIQIARIREMLAGDLRRQGANAHPDLEKYIYEITGILESNEVEILQCQQLDKWNPKIMEASKRIQVTDPTYDGKVYKVYRDGYRWNDKVIMPMKVDVLVYEK